MTGRILVSCGVVALGCSSPATPPTNHASSIAITAPPCPENEELTSIVKAAWGAGAKVALCVPLVRDGKAMWWLEGSAEAPPNTMHEVPTKHAMVRAARELVWHGDAVYSSGFGYVYMGGRTAKDLDSDGSDEALYERTTGEGGMGATELVIVYFEPAPVVMTVPLGWSGGEDSCNGAWSAVSRTRIVVDRSGDCEAAQRRETYERRGNSFKKI